MAGYTWQDDATQQGIARELLLLPKIPLRRLSKNFPDFKLRYVSEFVSSHVSNMVIIWQLYFISWVLVHSGEKCLKLLC